jgi:hypothetical protein
LRINDRTTTSVGGTAGAARTAQAGTRFSLGDAAGPARPGSAQAAAPASALDGLLAVQAAGDSLERRKRALRRGHGLLDGLDRLKVGLITGEVSGSALLDIRRQLMQQREQADDPALDEILAHVELRAEVELAKLAKR